MNNLNPTYKWFFQGLILHGYIQFFFQLDRPAAFLSPRLEVPSQFRSVQLRDRVVGSTQELMRWQRALSGSAKVCTAGVRFGMVVSGVGVQEAENLG